MSEAKMNWDDLRLFLAVARRGGLSAAARDVGSSAPTLGRRMLALEAALGADLFRRLPRGYALTPAGEELREKASALEAQIGEMGGQGETVVKISAGVWMTRVLCGRVAALSEAGVRLRFIAADERLDIARREAVIGIRNARPEAVGLACRRVGQVRFAGYTAKGAGDVPWVRVMGATPSARWVAEQGGAGPEVTHPRNGLDMARAGAVRMVLPMMVGDAEPDLVQVTDVIEALTHDQWLVSHHEARFVGPVRRVIDRLGLVLDEVHGTR